MGLRAVVMPDLSGNFFTVDLDAARLLSRRHGCARHGAAMSFQAVCGWCCASALKRRSLLGRKRHHSAVAQQRRRVFDAEVDEDEQEELPRLQGPQGHSRQVLEMYRQLDPLMAALGLRVRRCACPGVVVGTWCWTTALRWSWTAGPRRGAGAHAALHALWAEVVAQFQRKPEMLARRFAPQQRLCALRLRGEHRPQRRAGCAPGRQTALSIGTIAPSIQHGSTAQQSKRAGKAYGKRVQRCGRQAGHWHRQGHGGGR